MLLQVLNCYCQCEKKKGKKETAFVMFVTIYITGRDDSKCAAPAIKTQVIETILTKKKFNDVLT